MDATVVDLTADSSSCDDDDDLDDVIITGWSTTTPLPVAADMDLANRAAALPPPPTKTSTAPAAKTILIAEELSASKFVDHNMETYAKMRSGDLVEFHRGLYTHWGVFIGDGKIVHLSGDEDDGLSAGFNAHLGSVSGSVFTISGVNFKKAKVKCDDFWDVARKSKADVNNSKDGYIRADAPHVIVNRALSRMGVIGYNMLWSNCEHFASWCRYGMAWSEQVDKFMRIIDRGKSILSSTLLLVGITPPNMRPYIAEEKDGDGAAPARNKFPQLEYFH